MPTPTTGVRLDKDMLDAARRKMGLPADTPAAQVIRAAVLRFLGHSDADGSDVDRGGRPRLSREPADR